jgi:predicted metal-dependent phosphotriesterase family hydrolase
MIEYNETNQQLNMVQTVCGLKSVSALGHCQIHEHIFVRPTPMAEKNPALVMDDAEKSLRELCHYRELGGTTIVDAQPVGAGRDAQMLADLSLKSGVNIIASTGYHLLGFYPADSWIHALSEDALYELFSEELTHGMVAWNCNAASRGSPTGSLAGMVKAAIPASGTEGRYAVLLRAAARAAADHGVPLMLHTEKGQHAQEALKLCFSQGVRTEKLIVCHADRQASDFSVHDALADTGVYLDYDTVSRFKYHSNEAEIALLRHMLDRGNGAQILLSLDTTAARLTAYGGAIGLTHLMDTFCPLLVSSGIDAAAVALFNHENCYRLFAG